MARRVQRRAQKIGMKKPRAKVMFTAYFYAEGIIHSEFVPENRL
jgi:hypothetical protein